VVVVVVVRRLAGFRLQTAVAAVLVVIHAKLLMLQRSACQKLSQSELLERLVRRVLILAETVAILQLALYA
jgi:hypothetical protein